MDNSEIRANIFAGLFKENNAETQLRRQEFIKMFSDPKVFTDEYYVFAVLVKNFARYNISPEFLTTWMTANKLLLSKSANINLTNYTMGEGSDAYTEFMQTCMVAQDECRMRAVENGTFMEALEMYKMEYIKEESVALLETGSVILSEGVNERGKLKAGYDDMRTHVKAGFMRLDALTEVKARRGLITYGVNDLEGAEEENRVVNRIAPYGIASLDKHLGGIWEGEMISLLAPAKGGKSRMATFILHSAITSGTNVLMWSIENGYKGWEALLRARQFESYYNSKASDVTQRKVIDDDKIRKGALSEEMKTLERISWDDLCSNKGYGKITSVDDNFDVDTFLEIVDVGVKTTGAKLICIDYLQLVQGVGRASKQERVAEAYQKTLQYLKSNKIAGIFPGQFKQTVTGNLSRVDASDFANMELRDSAGESYEVIKTPDINLGLYASMEELKQGKMRIVSIPSRNHKPFDPIELNCALGSCTFADATQGI